MVTCPLFILFGFNGMIPNIKIDRMGILENRVSLPIRRAPSGRLLFPSLGR
jgi:hypothetical protein